MELSNSTVVKTPEADSETPTRNQPGKTSPFSNGVLKRHQHPVVVSYKECMKNHAASLGGHAVDGCGEFMPSPTSNPAQPTSLKCAACGCHRNFHRREPDDPPPPALEFQPQYRHHPPPPAASDNSPSPPPISSAYYPSGPRMLIALSHGLPDGNSAPIPISINTPLSSSPNASRKRFRTKFTQDQKEQMLQFAETVDWRMQKKDEELITDFCSKIGVEKGVFKVWMHNNKNSFGKKDPQTTPKNTSASTDDVSRYGFHLHETNDDNGIGQDFSHHHLHNNNGSSTSHSLPTNASSS